MMKNSLLKYSLGWGLILWLIGYVLGTVLFFTLPEQYIGVVLTPVDIIITLLVLFKVVKSTVIRDYLIIGIVWTVIAAVLDYLLIVLPFSSPAEYYKWDIYLYYSLTFVLPLIAGYIKKKRENIVAPTHPPQDIQ